MAAKRRPVDMSKYPPNWKQISQSIRERAGNKCEWCGIPNHSVIHRLKLDPVSWILHETWEALADDDKARYGKASKIFMTVSHFDHDTTHNDPSNLNCLCNRCHLNHDAHHHAKNARQTRIQKRQEMLRAVGQQSFIDDVAS